MRRRGDRPAAARARRAAGSSFRPGTVPVVPSQHMHMGAGLGKPVVREAVAAPSAAPSAGLRRAPQAGAAASPAVAGSGPAVAEQPAEQPAGQPAERPGERPAQQPTGQPAATRPAGERPADHAPPPLRAPQPAPRVALFLPNLGGGGAERVTLNLGRGLLDAGYGVDLVLAAAEGSYLEQAPVGAHVHDLGASRTLAALPRLARYLRRRQPDALVSAISHANVVAVWAARLAGYRGRVVVAEHGHPGLVPARPGARLRRWLVRDAYRRASRVVAVSQGLKDAWVERLGLPPETVEVIYNPVVTPEAREAMQQAPAHPFFDERDDGPVLVAVGRLSREKNFANLLRALARLRQRVPARLILLGEGAERPALERLADELGVREAVSMPGFQDNPHGYLAQADLFVLSSDWEGLPTALIEALAAGTPVVSTDCPVGPREILAGGERGELVPPGDSEALAEAMLRTLSHGRPQVDPAWLEPFTLERATTRYVQAMGVAP